MGEAKFPRIPRGFEKMPVSKLGFLRVPIDIDGLRRCCGAWLDGDSLKLQSELTIAARAQADRNISGQRS